MSLWSGWKSQELSSFFLFDINKADPKIYLETKRAQNRQFLLLLLSETLKTAPCDAKTQGMLLFVQHTRGKCETAH